MTLDEWLTKKKLSNAELAEQLGVATRSVADWRAGHARPFKTDLMQKLIDLTGGEVTANDFYNLPAPTEPERAAS